MNVLGNGVYDINEAARLTGLKRGRSQELVSRPGF